MSDQRGFGGDAHSCTRYTRTAEKYNAEKSRNFIFLTVWSSGSALHVSLVLGVSLLCSVREDERERPALRSVCASAARSSLWSSSKTKTYYDTSTMILIAAAPGSRNCCSAVRCTAVVELYRYHAERTAIKKKPFA